jgi:hypothetical protein
MQQAIYRHFNNIKAEAINDLIETGKPVLTSRREKPEKQAMSLEGIKAFADFQSGYNQYIFNQFALAKTQVDIQNSFEKQKTISALEGLKPLIDEKLENLPKTKPVEEQIACIAEILNELYKSNEDDKIWDLGIAIMKENERKKEENEKFVYGLLEIMGKRNDERKKLVESYRNFYQMYQ